MDARRELAKVISQAIDPDMGDLAPKTTIFNTCHAAADAVLAFIEGNPEALSLRWTEADLTVVANDGVQVIRARRLVGQWELPR